ncbi:MAG: hypothetical protein ACOZE5_05080 [Verrucomicrobiota bacterium]
MRFTPLVMFLCAFTAASGPGRITETQNALILSLEVEEVKRGSQDSLEFVARDRAQEGSPGLVVRIPPVKLRRWPSGARPYRYPVFLEPLDEDSKRVFDDLVTRKYSSDSSRLSIFKRADYDSASLEKPNIIGKQGGRIVLADPGIDGGVVWDIEIRYVPNERLLEIKVAQAYL